MVSVTTGWDGSFMASTYMCNTYGDLYDNNCNTISQHPIGFKECYWTNSWKLPLYIEETCYKGLTEAEKEIARSGGSGMVKDGIWKTFVRVEQYGNRYEFNPDAVIPYPEDNPYILDTIIDNKELIALLVAAGLIVVASLEQKQ